MAKHKVGPLPDPVKRIYLNKEKGFWNTKGLLLKNEYKHSVKNNIHKSEKSTNKILLLENATLRGNTKWKYFGFNNLRGATSFLILLIFDAPV